jgi:DNA-binding response OmpR family regulator
MNILIVDDQPNIARVTAVALGLLGCRAFTTSTTAGAIEILGTEKIDALFLDVNLRGNSGMEFLSELAAQDHRPPVIMFSAGDKDEFAAEALRRGALNCLTKPFHMDDLRLQMAHLEQYLRQREGSLICPECLDYI